MPEGSQQCARIDPRVGGEIRTLGKQKTRHFFAAWNDIVNRLRSGDRFLGLAHHWLPAYTATSGAHALVGMGTLFAGIVRAPMTSVLMIFETTQDYAVIVPLMISNLVSFSSPHACCGSLSTMSSPIKMEFIFRAPLRGDTLPDASWPI